MDASHVAEHATLVRETKEKYSSYINQSKQLEEAQADLDAIDDKILTVDQQLKASMDHHKMVTLGIKRMEEDRASAVRLLERMMELESEEKAAKLGA